MRIGNRTAFQDQAFRSEAGPANQLQMTGESSAGDVRCSVVARVATQCVGHADLNRASVDNDASIERRVADGVLVVVVVGEKQCARAVLDDSAGAGCVGDRGVVGGSVADELLVD